MHGKQQNLESEARNIPNSTVGAPTSPGRNVDRHKRSVLSLFHPGYASRSCSTWVALASDRRARGRKVPAHPKPGLAAAERELSVPGRRWSRSVPAVAEPLPLLEDGWRPAALTLTLGEPAHSSCRGRIGPATRESAWQRSASESSRGGPACH